MSPPNRHPLKDRISLVRRDLGHLLFHFTRESTGPVVIEREGSKQTLGKGPEAVLQKIITEQRLIGSSRMIEGNHKCVCFTEAPITEMAALFSLVKIAESASHHTRYRPYGIAVKKEWLFARGGRPVIYQPQAEYSLLPPGLQFRHVRYEPDNGIDFTWEREWRIRTDELTISPSHGEVLVVVPSADEAFDVTKKFCAKEPDDFDKDGNPQRCYEYPTWLTVSLDLFGLTD